MGYSGQGNRTVSYPSTSCDLFRFSCSTRLATYGFTGMLGTIEGLFVCFVFALLFLECRLNGTMPMSPMFFFHVSTHLSCSLYFFGTTATHACVRRIHVFMSCNIHFTPSRTCTPS